MTTMPERTATLTELVAAQIRSLLGYRDMKRSELARSIGENDQWLHVRLTGKVPLNVNDMHRIALALDVPVGQLMPPAEVAARAVAPGPRELKHPYISVGHSAVTDSRPGDRPIGRTGRADSTRPRSAARRSTTRPANARPSVLPRAS